MPADRTRDPLPAIPDTLGGALAPEALRDRLGDAFDLAREFEAASLSAATRRAYRADLRRFGDWCAARGVAALPAAPETVAAFLAAEAAAGARSATLTRRRAAIRHIHRLARHDHPDLADPTDAETVRQAMRGIRRAKGTAPERKAPATAERVLAMVEAIDADTLVGLRDRALLLLGFGAALRRSELVALDVADLDESPEGLRLTIRRSKTDQEGAGATVAVVRGARACPVAAVRAWMAAAGITEGALFRPVAKGGRVGAARLTDRSVANVIKARAAAVGLDPAAFSGHSLRAGFLTSAAARGASLWRMMDVSRHRSVETVRGYVRQAEAFRDHAGEGLL